MTDLMMLDVPFELVSDAVIANGLDISDVYQLFHELGALRSDTVSLTAPLAQGLSFTASMYTAMGDMSAECIILNDICAYIHAILQLSGTVGDFAIAENLHISVELTDFLSGSVNIANSLSGGEAVIMQSCEVLADGVSAGHLVTSAEAVFTADKSLLTLVLAGEHTDVSEVSLILNERYDFRTVSSQVKNGATLITAAGDGYLSDKSLTMSNIIDMSVQTAEVSDDKPILMEASATKSQVGGSVEISVYAPAGYKLRHNDADVQLVRKNVRRTVTETLRMTDGRAVLKYPAVYVRTDILHSGQTVYANGCAAAVVSYDTVCDIWSVTSGTAADVYLCLEGASIRTRKTAVLTAPYAETALSGDLISAKSFHGRVTRSTIKIMNAPIRIYQTLEAEYVD
jgi:hypothetical protein